MRIDGKDAVSGTIVIGAGKMGVVELPFGIFSLVFNPDRDNRNVSLDASTRQIVFDGTDNPLGTAATLNLPLQNGQLVTITFAVYAIGEGANATRVVHYTTSR